MRNFIVIWGLFALIVVPAHANQCLDLFSKTKEPMDFVHEAAAAYRRGDQAIRTFKKIEQIAQLEYKLGRLQQHNRRRNRHHAIKMSRRKRELKRLLYLGDKESAINMAREPYRRVEISAVKYLNYQNQIDTLNLLDFSKMGMAQRLSAQARRQASVKSLEVRKKNVLKDMGEWYAEYRIIKDLIDFLTSDPFVGKMDPGTLFDFATGPHMKPVDGELSDLALARNQAIYETAKHLDNILKVNNMKNWYPNFEGIQYRPTQDAIKRIFNSEPDALIAMLKYYIRGETVRLFKTWGVGIAQGFQQFLFLLPPKTKPLLEKVLGLSYDVVMADTYAESVFEVHHSGLPIREKFLLFLKKSGEGPDNEFIETYARVAEVHESFVEFHQYAKDNVKEFPDALGYIETALANRPKLGGYIDLQGQRQPQSRAMHITMAIITGDWVLYKTTDREVVTTII
ncbi:MAG: hypothetical protein CL677_10460, partial [Bdellovibrionaceae bacterium]|nr:hypothetical protein [Pseudobdellovibrionaceae bacterium]